MRAVMLAAGVGARLGASQGGRPKVLLRFGGRTLLARHLAILGHLGVEELVLALGYRAAEVEAELEAELEALAPAMAVRTVYNPDYREGSIVSLWCLREALKRGGEVMLMDADVLYDHRLVARLRAAPEANCLAMDRDFEPGDEPVKICLRQGRLVDFHKRPRAHHEVSGEWVGFVRLSSSGARALVAAVEAYIAAGWRHAVYEEAIRETILGAPEAFGVADITGLPWIEIDFAEDVTRARHKILPRLEEPGP
ncbi:MAG: phosphocholine cytidylyltransferase family protein [Alphaproteobacteria bacterium]